MYGNLNSLFQSTKAYDIKSQEIGMKSVFHTRKVLYSVTYIAILLITREKYYILVQWPVCTVTQILVTWDLIGPRLESYIIYSVPIVVAVQNGCCPDIDYNATSFHQCYVQQNTSHMCCYYECVSVGSLVVSSMFHFPGEDLWKCNIDKYIYRFEKKDF